MTDAISLGQGATAITLLVIRCNSAPLQEALMMVLQTNLQTESLQGPIHILDFSPSRDDFGQSLAPSSAQALRGRDIFNRIHTTMEAGMPGVVVLLGVDTHPRAAKLWADLNPWREEFRRTFPFPILLWLTDDGYRQFSQFANDFESISGGPSLQVALPPKHLDQIIAGGKLQV
ncbi:MAG: hypothetical protein AB4042_14785 [Leptolyngbyaceae cyanobacterium]